MVGIGKPYIKNFYYPYKNNRFNEDNKKKN